MRTLLEFHYDSVHFERWKKRDGKAPLRRSEYPRARSMPTEKSSASDSLFPKTSNQYCKSPETKTT